MADKYQEKLKRIARGVREYLQDEWVAKDKSSFGYDKDLAGLCGHASVILFQRLKKLGMKPKVISGVSHYFVVCNGFLVDITASQFGQAKICVRKYNKVKEIIKSQERCLDFWKEQTTYNSLRGQLKEIARDVNFFMRAR